MISCYSLAHRPTMCAILSFPLRRDGVDNHPFFSFHVLRRQINRDFHKLVSKADEYCPRYKPLTFFFLSISSSFSSRRISSATLKRWLATQTSSATSPSHTIGRHCLLLRKLKGTFHARVRSHVCIMQFNRSGWQDKSTLRSLRRARSVVSRILLSAVSNSFRPSLMIYSSSSLFIFT